MAIELKVKYYGGFTVEIHPLLTSVLDGGQWLRSRPVLLNPQEKSPRYKLNKKTALDILKTIKACHTCRKSKYDHRVSRLQPGPYIA